MVFFSKIKLNFDKLENQAFSRCWKFVKWIIKPLEYFNLFKIDFQKVEFKKNLQCRQKEAIQKYWFLFFKFEVFFSWIYRGRIRMLVNDRLRRKTIIYEVIQNWTSLLCLWSYTATVCVSFQIDTESKEVHKQ